jgi:hypothetical protein
MTMNDDEANQEARRVKMAIRLDQLAERLGVVPWNVEQGPSWLIRFGTNTYDVFDLINAALDKLDERQVE